MFFLASLIAAMAVGAATFVGMDQIEDEEDDSGNENASEDDSGDGGAHALAPDLRSWRKRMSEMTIIAAVIISATATPGPVWKFWKTRR